MQHKVQQQLEWKKRRDEAKKKANGKKSAPDFTTMSAVTEKDETAEDSDEDGDAEGMEESGGEEEEEQEEEQEEQEEEQEQQEQE